jgi:hypothetical protein
MGENNKLFLIDHEGKCVAVGHKIKQCLYKMSVTPRKETKKDIQIKTTYVYTNTENKQSWETWHKRLGHVSYRGMKELLNKNLVCGLKINEDTPKPDCMACTEAKLAIEPYKKKLHTQRIPGELTHIDVWGKYNVVSINGRQYYLVFVDNTV